MKDGEKWAEEAKNNLTALHHKRGKLFEELELLNHAIEMNERIITIKEGCECLKKSK